MGGDWEDGAMKMDGLIRYDVPVEIIKLWRAGRALALGHGNR